MPHLAFLAAFLCSFHAAAALCHVTEELGCLVDNTRLLNGYANLGTDGSPMDHDICAQMCLDHKMAVAGVEAGHQCFCGSALPAGAKKSTGCTAKCSSNSTESCGGNYALWAYKFACSGKPTPLPPAPGHIPGSPNLCPDFSRDYCQPGVPLEERIGMVMAHMTVEDKMMTMGEKGISGKWPDGSPLAARGVSWWNEALHGVCRDCENGHCATQFPEANSMGSSFNASLWRMIGETISTEARAYYNVGGLNGLTFFAPQLNLAANPSAPLPDSSAAPACAAPSPAALQVPHTHLPFALQSPGDNCLALCHA